MLRNIHNELLDHRFTLSGRPKRIVSLVSSATEAMDKMGLINRVVGVSEYCDRYIHDLQAPVVGEYLNCDTDALKNLQPDLILTTGGIQLNLARKLAQQGFPVYALPLPQSFFGTLENNLILGGLLGELEKARHLCTDMQRRASALRLSSPSVRPSIYLELWLGRHMRAVGGGSFINDLIDIAGGDLIYKNHTLGYFKPDFDAVAQAAPDVYLFFHEPEYLIDPAELVADRKWNPDTPVILSTIECGQNMIQEGPSMLDTAEWLQNQLLALPQ
ncbi:MAG: ABC transporter substrate-binding protein [Verrucomicrobiae bacterium]|nr:ABC transporter substrate-binding protein [Verrucomicrobiae bacterium]NNJ43574.1 ABC transporter substrate-binding protein [Akkermansiaceae bacterium]